MQLGVGFEPRALLANYLNDPVSDNYSVLIALDADKDVKGASRTHAKSWIRLNTEVPGPRGREMIARRLAAVPAGLGKATDVVVERAEGSLIFDVDGNTLIDLAGGIGMLAVGHSPAPVVKAIAEQAQKFVHVCSLVATYEPYVRLAEMLNEMTPGTFTKKTIFANSGAESVENAVKLSRKYTGRPAIICFEGGYHGRTLLTLSLTSKYGLFKSGFGPFAPEIVRLPIPHLYRTPAGMTEEQYLDFAHPAARTRAGRAGRSVGGRRDDHRAGPGRGRLHPGAAALPPPHPRAVRRARHRDDRRRGAVRLRPHRPHVRRASTTAWSPICSSARSRSAPACRSARSPAARRSWTRRISAASAAPTAAARSPAPRRSKR